MGRQSLMLPLERCGPSSEMGGGVLSSALHRRGSPKHKNCLKESIK